MRLWGTGVPVYRSEGRAIGCGGVGTPEALSAECVGWACCNSVGHYQSSLKILYTDQQPQLLRRLWGLTCMRRAGWCEGEDGTVV